MNRDDLLRDRRKLIALHEAGHCVGHVAFAWPFLYASIQPRGDFDGEVKRDPRAAKPQDELMAMTSLAGKIGVDILVSRSWIMGDPRDPDFAFAKLILYAKYFPAPKLASSRNLEVAAQVAAAVAKVGISNVATYLVAARAEQQPDEAIFVEKRLAKLCRATEKLLRRLWPQVIAVADGLLRSPSGTLSYTEIVAIAAAAAPDRNP